MNFIIIGRHEGCKWCDMAVQALRDAKHEFYFFDATGWAKEFLHTLGLKTVPQVWYGTKYIGGYEALVRYLECGEAPAS